MKLTNKIIIFLFILTSVLFAQSKQQFVNIGDLQLSSGETLLDCKIGYRTFGELNSDSSNIVIYPTWFGGTAEHITGLIGPNKLVDDSKFFVIAIDALANGVSTSPSNSKLQSGKDFPKISIDDMVNSQYKMLTENFEFKHIHAIIGGSMGSLQALQWIVTYPDFISKAIPYVASPRRSTYDMLIMQFRKRMIESYQELGADDKLINTMINYTTQLFVRSPEYIIENISHDDFESYIEKKIENRKPSKTFTIENHLAQLKAMMSYNIYKDFNNSVEETAKHIKTEVFFILGENDMLLHPKPALELANELNCEVLLLENNSGHLAVGAELEKCGRTINTFLNKTVDSQCMEFRNKLYDSMAHPHLAKYPRLVEPFEDISTRFNSLVDSTIFTKRIYIRLLVDTTGSVKCSRLLRGINETIDSVALDFAKSIKFYPAEQRIYTSSNEGGLVNKYKVHEIKRKHSDRGYKRRKVMAEISIPLIPKNE